MDIAASLQPGIYQFKFEEEKPITIDQITEERRFFGTQSAGSGVVNLF